MIGEKRLFTYLNDECHKHLFLRGAKDESGKNLPFRAVPENGGVFECIHTRAGGEVYRVRYTAPSDTGRVMPEEWYEAWIELPNPWGVYLIGWKAAPSGISCLMSRDLFESYPLIMEGENNELVETKAAPNR